MMIDVTVAADFTGDMAQVYASMNPLAAGGVLAKHSGSRAVFVTPEAGRFVITGQDLDWSKGGAALLGGTVEALIWHKGGQDLVRFATLQTTGDALWAAMTAEADMALTQILSHHCWTYHGSDLAETLGEADLLALGASDLRGNDKVYLYGGDDVFFTGAANDDLYGGTGHDLLSGGIGDDLLNGGSGNDDLSGGTGDDVLQGWIGDDSLSGGEGNDALSGGLGGDRLEGGAGNDVMSGGGQADLFVFAKGAGQDVITDYEVGQDHLLIQWDHRIEVVARGEDSEIVYGRNHLLLVGVEAGLISDSDFV